jgi:hypothetical protein
VLIYGLEKKFSPRNTRIRRKLKRKTKNVFFGFFVCFAGNKSLLKQIQKTFMTKLLIYVSLILCFGAVFAQAQATPDYKISKIKIVPFEQSSGSFEDEIAVNDDRAFFNDLSKALFVTVEISGKAESYEARRELQITVTEGAKVKTKKIFMSGILNEKGKFYFPFWLDAPMCSEVKITARITGQKNASTTTRKVSFQCGE